MRADAKDGFAHALVLAASNFRFRFAVRAVRMLGARRQRLRFAVLAYLLGIQDVNDTAETDSVVLEGVMPPFSARRIPPELWLFVHSKNYS